MMRVFRDAGYETRRHLEVGEVSLEFDIDETAADRGGDARARAARRGAIDPAAAAPDVRSRSIGASNDGEQDRQRRVPRTCCAAGSTGTLYPVNPDATSVRRARRTRG